MVVAVLSDLIVMIEGANVEVETNEGARDSVREGTRSNGTKPGLKYGVAAEDGLERGAKDCVRKSFRLRC